MLCLSLKHIELKKEKVDGVEIESEPADLKSSYVRVIENGVVMNYSTAKEIHNWLGSHIEQLEKFIKL